MSETRTFYYRFNRLNAWLILNIALLITLVSGMICWPCLMFWVQTQVLVGVMLFSWFAWGYKYLVKHPAVIVDDEKITIDNCEPLYWKDIKNAEQKIVRCWFRKYKVIALNPKDNIDYKYNFLQRHNCGFTAFSIPLYGILSKEDAAEITRIIAEKTDLVRLPDGG